MKFRNFQCFIISNITFDIVTGWLSKHIVHFICYDKIILFAIMETCSLCFLQFYFSEYLSREQSLIMAQTGAEEILMRCENFTDLMVGVWNNILLGYDKNL